MIIDLKTGVRESWHELQTAAYERCAPNIVEPLIDFTEDGHVYRRAGRLIPGVTQVLNETGYISDFAKYSVFRREVGTAVHKACALLPDRLDWKSVDPRIEGYIKSFVKWYERAGFVIVDQEECVYHYMWDFAGQLDLRGRFGELGINGRGALYLDPNGKVAKFRLHDKRQDWQEFLMALKLWRKEHGSYGSY